MEQVNQMYQLLYLNRQHVIDVDLNHILLQRMKEVAPLRKVVSRKTISPRASSVTKAEAQYPPSK